MTDTMHDSGFFKEQDDNDPMTIVFKELGMAEHQWECWQLSWHNCEKYHNLNNVPT